MTHDFFPFQRQLLYEYTDYEGKFQAHVSSFHEIELQIKIVISQEKSLIRL